MPDVLKGEAGPLFLLLYLLPGFLGAVMYYYLVEGEKPDNFERVIHALALTLASSLVVHGIFHFSLLPDISLTKDTSSLGVLNAVLGRSLLYITVMSVIIAVVFAILVNHDII